LFSVTAIIFLAYSVTATKTTKAIQQPMSSHCHELITHGFKPKPKPKGCVSVFSPVKRLNYLVFLSFQITRRFDFSIYIPFCYTLRYVFMSRYITRAMYL
jgi:hypothetical protein